MSSLSIIHFGAQRLPVSRPLGSNSWLHNPPSLMLADQTQGPNYRAVVATAWSGMLVVLLAMLVLEPLRYAMTGNYAGLTDVLRVDPGPKGLTVLVALLCLNAVVQVVVHARSCRTARVSTLVLSVLYGLFFLAHNIIHFMGGEPLGLQSVLDGTHHVLAALAVWGAWQWHSAA